MDNIAAIIFACERDREHLDIAVRSLLNYGIPVTVAFDQADNCPTPEFTARLVTNFPRGHSLNESPECVAGMIEAISHIHAATVLKMDCDTVLTGGIEHIRLGDYDLIGQKQIISVSDAEGNPFHSYSYALGHAYMLSRSIIDQMIEHKPTDLLRATDDYSRNLLSSNPGPVKWPEDETMSLIAQMLAPDPNRWLLTSKALPIVAHYDHATKKAPTGIFTNFGYDSDREKVIAAMRHFKI